MTYLVTENKEGCKQQLSALVENFQNNISSYQDKRYSEAQLRIDFLNPLLKSFGWDVSNEKRKVQSFRDVIQEESIDVEEVDKITKKNPDYTLKQFGNRCLFVEAKRVSIDIINSQSSAFQTRRYGWNANLGVSVLTNFEHIVFYDCHYKPSAEDNPSKARYTYFHYTEFLDQLDELYSLLSYESVQNGYLDNLFNKDTKNTESFDEHFLNQIESWRFAIAGNVIKNNADLSQDDINFLIQRLINRIIFLRICEDREIEKYKTLKYINTYGELKQLFTSSDNKYNSGLFDFIEDDLTHEITIDDSVLIRIFTELYYPISPYDFSVVDPAVLSQIYEQYLGSKIELSQQYSISIKTEPEVIASNGVVPTPKRIVKQIVEETLNPLFLAAESDTTYNLKLADICCGSGTFLIIAFDYLVQKREEFYITSEIDDISKIIKIGKNQWKLSLQEKHQIIMDNIHGVDINPYAVEVAKFSLLLKLIENETNASVEAYLQATGEKVLPSLNENIKCGNSLLDDNYYQFNPNADADDELLYKLNSFNWVEEFSFLEEKSGFDVIIGNPPYVRIQNFIKYSKEEIEYYRSKFSPYSVAKKDTFDKYYLFIERAISLLKNNGRLGYIVPHKFFIVKGGSKLRKSIKNQVSLERIIHFGVTQVFPNRSTYTAILILLKTKIDTLSFSRINSLSSLDVFEKAPIINYQNDNYTNLPWIFISEAATQLFERIINEGTIPLKSIAEIPVGLQTSADYIYIFEPLKEDDVYYHLKNTEGLPYKIEKDICRPCLYNVRFNLFDTLSANTKIIFPYTIKDDMAIVIPEHIMEDSFPECWKYLNLYKEKLAKRSINVSNPIWYQFGRSQSLTKFHDIEKIIFPVLSTKPNYAIDKTNIQFTGGGNGPYYSIIPKGSYSIYYILGLLTHPILEAMIKSRASEFKGEYYSHGKQFIENLPIKTINFEDEVQKTIYNTINQTVSALIETKCKLSNNKRQALILIRKIVRLKGKLLQQINLLYGFSEEDVECITDNNLFAAPIEEV